MGGSTAYDGITNLLATTSGGAASVAVIASGDTVTFDGSSPAGAVVTTSAAISCTTLTLNTGFTGSLTMSNSLTVSGTLTLTQGTLNTNGQTCSWGTFSSNNSNVRTLTMGSSNITLTNGATTAWNCQTTTNLTVTANTATVTSSGGGGVTVRGALNWQGMSWIATGGGSCILGDAMTFANYTFTGTATNAGIVSLGGTLTITSAFTITGNSQSNYVTCKSSVAGTARTITDNGTFTATNVHIQDTTAAGTAAPFYANTLGCEDLGNNSKIIFGSFMINNYQSVKVPDNGNAVMSVTERIR